MNVHKVYEPIGMHTNRSYTRFLNDIGAAYDLFSTEETLKL